MSRPAIAVGTIASRRFGVIVHTRAQRRPRLKPGERAFWVVLSKLWRDWRSPLILVKPATVIAWHRRRRISTDHPEWGEDRIAEELALKLGVTHSTSTVRRYMVRSEGKMAFESLSSAIGHRVGPVSRST